MTQAVAGDLAQVRSILPPGADAHEFEPKPSDVQALSESALVLKNGIGLDDWIDRVISNAGGERPLVVVTEGIPLREASKQEQAAGEGNEESGLDPHVWLDVANAMTMTRNIRDALAQVDPDNAGAYQANADIYLARLADVDKYIMDQVATVPPKQRKMVTNHDALGYFIERYGLTYVGSIIPSMSTEAQPSAQGVAALIEKIRSSNVKAIFLESSINPALARQIGKDAGVKVVDTLYIDTLGEPGSRGESYESMMRYNADTIVSALR
jgi:zinc/manganese transport system substrate-binding protein/manganese/iron transport system substrate-binding protein